MSVSIGARAPAATAAPDQVPRQAHPLILTHRDVAGPVRSHALGRPGRAVLGILLALAASIHAALIPEHFRERTAYGVFFLLAAAFQTLVAAALLRRREPRARVYRVALWGSLALIGLWIVTRAVAPPLGRGPEEVSAAGVAATGLELAALVALVLLPAADRNPNALSPRGSISAWAVIAGTTFALLFSLASSTLVYDLTALPSSIHVPSVAVYGGSFGTQSPWVSVLLTRHLYVHGAIATFVFLVLASVLLAAGIWLTIGINRAALGGCAPHRARWLGMAPSFLAVPSCCAAPLAGFLGAGAISPLLAATPWVLGVTTLFLAAQAVTLWRRYRILCG